MNAIAPVNMAMGEMWQLAQAIAKSSLFGMKTPEQALVLMSIAQAEGRHPALAARDYDIIQNRPAKKAEAMLRDFLEAGGKVEWHTLTDAIADATFSHPQGGSVRISWDMARAMQAGLGSKPTWKQFPRQMLRSRCVSEGVRTVYPLATSGLYVPEEAADMPAKEPHTDPTIEHEASAHPNPNDGPDRQPTDRDRVNAAIPLRAAAAEMKRADKIADKAKVYETTTTEPMTAEERQWLGAFERDCLRAKTEAQANAILTSRGVLEAERVLAPEPLASFLAIRDTLTARIWPQPPDEPTEDVAKTEAEAEDAWPGDEVAEVEIVGAEKVMSG